MSDKLLRNPGAIDGPNAYPLVKMRRVLVKFNPGPEPGSYVHPPSVRRIMDVPAHWLSEDFPYREFSFVIEGLEPPKRESEVIEGELLGDGES